MVLRRTGKVVGVVGFIICLSCLGIMYINLSSITEERNIMNEKKNEMKQQTIEKDARINNLEADIRALEKSLATCNTNKDLAIDRNSKVLEESEEYKVKLKSIKEELDQLRSDKSGEEDVLNGKIADLEITNSGLKESVSSCQSSSLQLQKDLSAAKDDIKSAGDKLSVCLQDVQNLKESNEKIIHAVPHVQDEVDVGDNDIVAVAAVPKGADEDTNVNNVVEHVADIPDPGNNKVVQVDNKEAIPEALVPIPVPVGVDNHGPPIEGVAPIPEQHNDAEQRLQDVIPLQPRPDQALVDTVNAVQQQQELQERLQQNQNLQPQLEEQDRLEQPAALQAPPPPPA